jgi:peptide/nickel transport system permease protein
MSFQGSKAEMELVEQQAAPARHEQPPVDPALRAEAEPPPAAAMSQWQLIRRRFMKHWLAVASLYILVVFYLAAIFAEIVAPYTPNTRNIDYGYSPPQLARVSLEHGLHTFAMQVTVDPVTFHRSYVELRDVAVPLRLFARGEPYRLWGMIPMSWRLLGVDHIAWERKWGSGLRVQDPEHSESLLNPQRQTLTTSVEPTFYLLGADKYGRDIFSRIIYGARISLSVGMIGIVFMFVLGMVIGGVSGYVGGRTDNVIQRGIEIINALPQLPLWLALAAMLPGDWSALRIYFAITILLSLLNWTGLARVVRGKILSLREEDYAVAARLMGAGHGRILFRHLMPGFASHIIVALTLSVPVMILGETSLSFLGLGLRPPVVSWGVMLQDAMDIRAVSTYPWLLAPVVFIVTTVLCFNFLGDGLRDAADPYSTK